jgi:hypothetical protein
MAAPGIYWLTLDDKLEAGGIEVYLVDPHGVKAVPGRKRDWLNCQWLQKLHTYGLRPRAFRPDSRFVRCAPAPVSGPNWCCVAPRLGSAWARP